VNRTVREKIKTAALVFFALAALILSAVLVWLVCFPHGQTPLADAFREEPLSVVYTLTGTDKSFEIREADLIAMRKPLMKLELIRPVNEHFPRNARDMLTLTEKDGTVHAITLLRERDKMSGWVGYVNYNGKDYLVDCWMYELFEHMLKEYRLRAGAH
jgi:hypothetical protein